MPRIHSIPPSPSSAPHSGGPARRPAAWLAGGALLTALVLGAAGAGLPGRVVPSASAQEAAGPPQLGGITVIGDGRSDEPLRRQAVAAAIAAARPKAHAAGLTLSGVRTVVELPAGGPSEPAETGLGAGREGIAAGQLALSAGVQVAFAVAR